MEILKIVQLSNNHIVLQKISNKTIVKSLSNFRLVLSLSKIKTNSYYTIPSIYNQPLLNRYSYDLSYIYHLYILYCLYKIYIISTI